MVELTALDGTPICTGSLVVPAGEQRAIFLQQISGLETIPDPFQGIVRVTSPSLISVAGLKGQYNERNELLISAVPAANEADRNPGGGAFFPHIICGGIHHAVHILQWAPRHWFCRNTQAVFAARRCAGLGASSPW